MTLQELVDDLLSSDIEDAISLLEKTGNYKVCAILEHLAAQRPSGEAKAITVTYRNTSPDQVYGVPAGCVLYCRDYDTELMAAEDGELDIDINGEEYRMESFTHEETKGEPPAKQQRFA